ncbi:MAG: PilZ domain-containing protein [Geobacter sp.]|jgi:hypothetical protein|nr:PilZ domain-containing protein [Geobacter sp.]
MSDHDTYLQHFPVGLKVTVGIPVPGGDTFHDWAVIRQIDEDLVSLQLSRDTLPENIRLTVGTIFDVRAGDETSGYSCRAIVVTEGYRREILLRLIGEVVSSELREFYRIDAFLPIRYFISEEQSEVKLKKNWQQKREERTVAEQERKERAQKPWERLSQAAAREELPAEERNIESFLTDSGEEDDFQEQNLAGDDTADHSWDDVIPLAANISGGGLRMLLHHGFQPGSLVPLEIYLPVEPDHRIIDAVGVVAFANENYAAGKQFQRTTYNTGLKFKFIDERDRDAIVSYISTVQLKRIRQMREQYLFRSSPASDPAPPTEEQRRMFVIKSVASAITVLALMVGLVLYFKDYAENRPKNQIEQIFDKGFEEYLKKIGRDPAASPSR